MFVRAVVGIGHVGRLQQALQNLITNALKHSSKVGVWDLIFSF
jgi:signal transduction histidine kinase